MSDLLRGELQRAAADGPAPAAGLYDGLVRRRRRRSRVRALTSGLAAVVALAGVVAVASLDRGGSAAVPLTSGAGTWAELPPSPLSPRHSPLAVAVGDEVLIFGGLSAEACPPYADCMAPPESARLRDGASFDTATSTWRRLASAPVPLDPTFRTAAVGEDVHLLSAGRHDVYSVRQNRWISRAPVPGGRDWFPRAVGSQLIAWTMADGPGTIMAYDAATDAWSALPPDPTGPSFNRSAVWTGTELVVLSAKLVPNPGSEEPVTLRAAALDLDTRTWRRLPDATQHVADFGWSWDGRRLVNPSTEVVDGGEVNPYPRPMHVGGTLDPATGRWGLLPRAPRQPDVALPDRLAVTESGDRYKAYGGLLYDSSENAWHVVSTDRPAGVAAYGGQAWVGDLLVVWGGFSRGGQGPVATGGLYRP